MRLRQLEKKLIKSQSELINLMEQRINALTKRQIIASLHIHLRCETLFLKIKILNAKIKKKHEKKALKI